MGWRAKKTWPYDGDRKTQISPVIRGKRIKEKGSLKARFTSHHWLNKGKRNGKNQRIRDERTWDVVNVEIDWITEARRS